MSGQGSVYKRCGCVDPVTGRQLGRRCPRLAGSRHGSWYVAVQLPAGLDGRRRRIRRGGYPSRAAAAAVLASLRGPRPGDPAGQVLMTGDWLAHWLASRSSPAASTIRGYAAHVRLYLAPYIGNVLLAELSAAHVQAMFTAITRQHQGLGSPVTAATLHRIRATLRAALNAAVRRGLIGDNPASRAELPRTRRPRAVVWTPERVEHWQHTGEHPPVAVWTAAQTAQFLNSISDHRLYAAYHLIALRGLRRGEAAGLRWRDVDLDGKAAFICQQLQQYDGRLAVCPPKTPHSVRVIALDRTTVAALRAHRDRQRAEATAYGPGWRASGYVFAGLNGDPMAPDRLSRIFRKLAAEAGLPPVSLHDLRHGAATLALAAGAELRTVQEQMGHSSIVLTADTYISVLPEVARAAAEKVAAGWPPGPGNQAARAARQPAAPMPRTQAARVTRSSRPADRPPAAAQPRQSSLAGTAKPLYLRQQWPSPSQLNAEGKLTEGRSLRRQRLLRRG